MKLTRKQLTLIIENYLNEERVDNQGHQHKYVVQPGDNLTKISVDKFNLGVVAGRGPVQQIVWLNNLKSPNISPGDKLMLPGITVYKVEPGDNISYIAEVLFELTTRDGVKPSQQIRNANNLKTDKLRVGQLLFIPRAGSKSIQQVDSIVYDETESPPVPKPPVPDVTSEPEESEPGFLDRLTDFFFGSEGEEDLAALKKKPAETSFDPMPLVDIKSYPIVSNSSPNRYLKMRGYALRHEGIDIAAPRHTPVYATGPGKIKVLVDPGGYGNYVIIDHSDGYSTLYGHLHEIEEKIKKKEVTTVKVGDKIGTVGNTGAGTGVHLHYEIRKQGKSRDVLNTDVDAPWRLTHEWVKKNLEAFTFKGDKKKEFDEIESKIQAGEIDKIESGER